MHGNVICATFVLTRKQITINNFKIKKIMENLEMKTIIAEVFGKDADLSHNYEVGNRIFEAVTLKGENSNYIITVTKDDGLYRTSGSIKHHCSFSERDYKTYKPVTIDKLKKKLISLKRKGEKLINK